MKRTIVEILVLLLTCRLAAQGGHQPFWVGGINEYPGVSGYGNFMVRFMPDGIIVDSLPLKMNFESTSAALADSSDNLLFYTNGCHIATSQGDTMPGGENLNPGEIHDWACPKNGYISPLGATILPAPGREGSIFYLIHMGANYDPLRKLTFGPLYFTVIDMTLNGGKGAVVSVNNVMASQRLETFSAVRHGNGRDWWIVAPVENTSFYLKWLLTPEGIISTGEQKIGTGFNCRYLGSTVFSPDGSRFARQQSCRTLVFDFDRCSGMFSMPVVFETPATTFGGGGVAFSKNGNQMFTTAQLAVLMADFSTSSPVLDTVFDWNYQWGMSLGLMQTAPDGNIYITGMSRNIFFNQIDLSPDTSFIAKAIKLPFYNVRTLPNSPNLRLLDSNSGPCDTLGIDTPVSGNLLNQTDGKAWMFPNPANTHFQFFHHLKSPGATFLLHDATGRLIRSRRLENREGSAFFNIENLPPGVYFWSLRTPGGESPLAGKLFVVRT